MKMFAVIISLLTMGVSLSASASPADTCIVWKKVIHQDVYDLAVVLVNQPPAVATKILLKGVTYDQAAAAAREAVRSGVCGRVGSISLGGGAS